MSVPSITKSDVQSLIDYVKGADAGGLNQAESTVMLHITHSNLQAKFMEIRLDLHTSIEAVKVKLSFHCGTTPGSMILQLLNSDGGVIASLHDDAKKLGFYSPQNGFGIHIIDSDPQSMSAGGWLENTSLVEKFTLSDEAYNARENSYRKWKNGKIKDDPSWTLEKEMKTRRGEEYIPPAPKISDPDHMKDLAEPIKTGERCSVDPGDRRGEVKFVGPVEGLPLGWWIGIHYDEPLGKNDGTVKGKKYFECPIGYGAFVRPDKVKVGDYPVIDEFDLEEGDEI